MVSDQGARPRDHKTFAKRAIVALTKERDYPSGAAAAYDTQEKKTRKIITASKRAVRDAEAVLKRR
jgi:hypothetical protein